MRKVDDPVAQHIHRENADRMLLGSFVAGLGGGRETGKLCYSPKYSIGAVDSPYGSKSGKTREI